MSQVSENISISCLIHMINSDKHCRLITGKGNEPLWIANV